MLTDIKSHVQKTRGQLWSVTSCSFCFAFAVSSVYIYIYIYFKNRLRTKLLEEL